MKRTYIVFLIIQLFINISRDFINIDRVEIFDTFGNLMYDEPIYYDQENHPNRYSVSYDGQTVVYNQNGEINRNATESYQ